MALGACASPDGNKAKPKVPLAAAPDASVATARTNVPEKAGVPHSGRIVLAAVAPDGSAAASRDEHGGLRVWRKLDGSAEPVTGPTVGARTLSVRRMGTRVRVALIDAAALLRVLDVSPSGQVTERFSTTPDSPLLDAVLLSDGRTVTLGTDHTLHILDESGVQQVAFSRRQFRPSKLFVSRAGDAILAVHAEPGATAAKNKLLWSRFAIAKNGFGGEATNEVEVTGSFAMEKLQASPSLTRLAISSKAPQWWNLAIVSTDQGQLLAESTDRWRHTSDLFAAFIGEHSLYVDYAGERIAWMYGDTDLKDGTGVVGNPSGNVTAMAAGGGTVLSALSSWLLVAKPKESTGLYLGYDTLAPRDTAISPSADRVAWVSSMGNLHVEDTRRHTMTELTPHGQTRWQNAVFIDEEHLVALDSAQSMHLIRWADAKTLASAPSPTGEVEYAHGYLLVNQGSGFFVTKVSPARGFSRTTAYPNQGAVARLQDDAGQPTLVIAENRRKIRKVRLGIDSKPRSDATDLAFADAAGLVDLDDDGASIQQIIRTEGGQRRTVVVRVLQGADVAAANAAADQGILLPSAAQRYFPVPKQERAIVVVGQSVMALDFAQGKILWTSVLLSSPSSVAVSADGSHVAIASNGGGRVLQVATGEVVSDTCAASFEARTSPPQNFLGARTICE